MEGQSKVIEIPPPPEDKVKEPIKKCDWCEYTFRNQFGFYSHASAKHPKEMLETYPEKFIRHTGRHRIHPLPTALPPISPPPTISEQKGDILPSLSSILPQSPIEVPLPPERPPKKKYVYPKPKKEIVRKEEDDDDLEEEIEEDPLKKNYRYIPTKKPVELSGKELHIAELLINAGFAKNLSEVQKKSMQMAYSLLSAGSLGGNNSMGENNQSGISVDKMMENLQKDEVRDLQLQQLRNKLAGKIQGGKKMEGNELLTILALTGGLGGNNKQENSLTQALEIAKLIQPQPQNNLDIIKVMELMRAMNPPQQQNPMQNIEFLKIMMEATNKNNNNNVVDVIKTLQTAMHDKDKQSYEKQLEIQRTRDEYNQKLMDMQIKQLQGELSKPREEMNFERLRDQISIVKQLSEEIGGSGKEPSTLDYIDSLGKNLSGPLTELLRAKNQRPTSPIPPPMRGMKQVQNEDEEEEEPNHFTEEEAITRHRQRIMPTLQPKTPSAVPPVGEEVSVIPKTPTEIRKAVQYIG